MMPSIDEIFRPLIGKFILLDQYDSEEEVFAGKIVEITETGFQELNHLNDLLHEYLVLSRKIDEICLNFKEIFEKIEYYKQRVREGDDLQQGRTQKTAFIDINRVFTNFIVSFKSLIEDYIINRHFTKYFSYKPELKAEFKSQTHIWYDSIFPYKFFSLIRNYAVHSNLPIQIISRSAPPLENPNASRIETFAVKFRKSTLLNNDVLRPKLSSDLNSFEEEFELLPILNEFEPFISELKRNCLRFTDNKYLNMALRLKEILLSVPNHRIVSFGKVEVIDEILHNGRVIIQEDIVDEIIQSSI